MGENEVYSGLRKTGRIWAESDSAQRVSPVGEERMRKGTAIAEREGWGFFPGIRRLEVLMCLRDPRTSLCAERWGATNGKCGAAAQKRS